MTQAIAHRGPDDAGAWSDPEAGVWLGHRRLSIQDVTPTGHQPMVSHSGRFVVVFNGEIYNANELRLRLEARDSGRAWRGHSDTEVMLEAMEAWGVVETLRSCYGMFALALWDQRERTLHLARDRFGEKPLYWGWQRGTLLFASELKAIREHPACERRIDVVALASFLERGYVPAPLSVYEGVSKVLPGTLLSFDLGRGAAEPRATAYWTLAGEVTRSRAHPPLERTEGIEALHGALQAAVRRQLVSDVPLGAFLSGGIDSSLVVAMMQSLSGRPVKTFTIGFQEAGFDESRYAERVARHLGTEHTCQQVSSGDAMAVIPDLPRIYDEPFADNSQIPTYLVARLARRHVTVALSGDGGDELFGGYNRYFNGVGIWQRSRRLPRLARRAAARAADLIPFRTIDRAASTFKGLGTLPLLAGRVSKGLRMLRAETLHELNSSLLAKWPGEDLPMVEKRARGLPWPEVSHLKLDPVEHFMYLDALTYLPDDILVKVDRAAMANGLETRVPFLDPDVLALAWSLPIEEKVRGRTGKLVVRDLLDRFVPREMFERPKTGFGIPIGEWLRGELREWGADMLETPSGRLSELVDTERLSALWRRHQVRAGDESTQLWPALMLAGWLEAWPN